MSLNTRVTGPASPRAEGEHGGYPGQPLPTLQRYLDLQFSHKCCDWWAQLSLEDLLPESKFLFPAISVKSLENQHLYQRSKNCTCVLPSIRWFLRQRPRCGATQVPYTFLSGQHSCKQVFAALGGPKPALALFSLTSGKFPRKATSTEHVAGNAHTARVLRTRRKLWSRQHGTEPGVTQCPQHDLLLYFSAASNCTALTWLIPGRFRVQARRICAYLRTTVQSQPSQSSCLSTSKCAAFQVERQRDA